MKLIGINGRARSGKDTAFSILDQLMPNATVQRVGFADKLKLSAVQALGYKPADIDEARDICETLKRSAIVIQEQDEHQRMRYITFTGRRYQQLYGTEAHRDVFGNNFWVDALLPQPDAFARGELALKFRGIDVLVITDVRFQNEAERILDLGGDVWRIDADKRLGPLPDDAHPSERPLADEFVTCSIPNNGTPEQFQVAVTSAWVLGYDV